MKNLLTVAAQLLALVALNKAGYAVAGALRPTLPGDVLGMLILLAQGTILHGQGRPGR